MEGLRLECTANLGRRCHYHLNQVSKSLVAERLVYRLFERGRVYPVGYCLGLSLSRGVWI